MVEMNAVEELIGELRAPAQDDIKTYIATVSRKDEEGVVWVRLAGADGETPTASTSAEVDRGDIVNVEWRNNKLYIAGNTSNPSVGIVRVEAVEAAAGVAQQAAANAVKSAGEAYDAAEYAKGQAIAAQSEVEGIRELAEAAQGSADTAQAAADGAMLSLEAVQNVVGVLDWVKSNGQYEFTEDAEFVEGRLYFSVTGTPVTDPVAQDLWKYYEYNSSTGIYTLTEDTTIDSQKTYHTLDATPQQTRKVYVPTSDTTVDPEKIYYELSGDSYIAVEPEEGDNPYSEGWYEYVDANPTEMRWYQLKDIHEAMEQYITSHLALEDDGLHVFSRQGSGWLLLAPNGVEVKDKNNNTVASYGQNSVIGNADGMHIEIKTITEGGQDKGFIGFYRGNSEQVEPTAYIKEDKLWIPQAVVVDLMQIGDDSLGAWQWVIDRESRNMNLMWVGEV